MPILGLLREGEYAKEDLLKILQDLCRRGRLKVRFGERVQGLERTEGVFSVRSTSGVTLGRFRIKKKNDDRITEILAKGRIAGAFGSEVEEMAPTSVRLRTPGGVRELPNDYVFVFAGVSRRSSSSRRWASA